MNQNHFIFDQNDTPQQKKKKIKAYFWGAVGIIFVLQIWPLGIILIIFNRQIIEAMEKAVFKDNHLVQNDSSHKNNKLVTPVKKYPTHTKPTGVKTDQHQATLAIIGFIILIVAMVAYYLYTKL